ncbi:DUF5946 family protein [Nocardia tengchongensis]|uniref:DUF5946 family protein n=1 Tax=Nocardia tengchongensis TaxID=2055889 RepID=UPI00368B7BE6
MNDWKPCPGCGLEMPQDRNSALPRKIVASAACWRVYNEVSSFALIHPPLDRWNQLSADAYGAQPSRADDTDPKPVRLVYSLVGLYLALEHGCSGEDVRAAHRMLGRPDPSWPSLSGPATSIGMTVMDVAERGLMRESLTGHAGALHEWVESVWSAWDSRHAAIAELSRRGLPDFLSNPVRRCWGYRL